MTFFLISYYSLLLWQDSLLPMPRVSVIGSVLPMLSSPSHCILNYSYCAGMSHTLICSSHLSPTTDPVSHSETCLLSSFHSQPLTQFSNPSGHVLAGVFPPSSPQLHQFSLISSWHSKGELLTTGPTCSPITGLVPQAQIFVASEYLYVLIAILEIKVQDLLHAKWSSFPLVACLCFLL